VLKPFLQHPNFSNVKIGAFHTPGHIAMLSKSSVNRRAILSSAAAALPATALPDAHASATAANPDAATSHTDAALIAMVDRLPTLVHECAESQAALARCEDEVLPRQPKRLLEPEQRLGLDAAEAGSAHNTRHITRGA
jgi:hypothetical protein